MRLKEAMRQGGGQKRSLWDKLFGIPHRSGRQEKVLEHIIHHIEDGTTLREVFQEEYVRRNATSEEIRRILENPQARPGSWRATARILLLGKLDPRQKR
jgi:hypothetical protein